MGRQRLGFEEEIRLKKKAGAKKGKILMLGKEKNERKLKKNSVADETQGLVNGKNDSG